MQNWIKGHDRDSRSLRRRLIAALRLAHRVLGLKRDRLGLGSLGIGRASGSALWALATSVSSLLAGLRAGAAPGASTFVLPEEPTCPDCGRVLAAFASEATKRKWMKLGWKPAAAAAVTMLALGAAPAQAGTAVGSGQYYGTGDGAVSIGTGPLCYTTVQNYSTGIGCTTNVSTLYSVGIGFGNTVQGTAATAIGANSVAYGDSSVAIGSSAITGVAGTPSIGGGIAIGTGVTASGGNSIVLGNSSLAAAAGSIAFGQNAQVSAPSTWGVAIGGGSRAQSTNTVAIGLNAVASGASGVALGQGTSASAASTTALGGGAQATASQATAVGWLADASGNDSVALGYNAEASGLNALAFGSSAQATSGQTIAIGAGSVASGGTAGGSSVALGQGARAIANGAGGSPIAIGGNARAIGTSGTPLGGNPAYTFFEAVAIGNNTDASGQGSVVLGISSAAPGNAASAVGLGAVASGENSIAFGTSAVADSTDAVAIGNAARATGGRAVSIGSGNVASGNGAVAIGDPNTATGNGAVAQGMDNTATGNGSVAVGNTNMVGGGGQAVSTAGTAAQGAVGIGYQNTVIGQGSVAIGSTSRALAAGAVAFGDTAVANNARDVALGSGSATAAAVGTPSTTILGTTYNFAGTAPTSTVSVGAAGAERTITNVAAGRISGTSTDAVNGSQLFATNQAVSTLGQGWTITAEGASATNVGTTSVTGNTIDLSNSDGNIVVAKDTASNNVTFDLASDLVIGNSITVGSSLLDTTGLTIAGGPSVTSTGIDAGGTTITNVAAGVNPTDAVNVSQLNNATSAIQTHYYSVNDGGAIGNNYNNDGATGLNSLAAGVAASSSGVQAAALGNGATAQSVQSVALGHNARVLETAAGASARGIVIGDSSTINNSFNSWILGQSNSISASTQVGILGGFNTITASQGSMVQGSNNTLTNSVGAQIFGAANSVDGSQAALVLGLQNSLTGSDTNTVIGSQNVLTGASDNFIGGYGNTFGTGLASSQVFANGGTTAAGVQNGILIGTGGTLGASNTVALGTGAAANNAGAVALGSGSTTAAAIATPNGTIAGTTYNFAGINPTSTMSVGAAGAERTVTNVAAGRISGTSTDAINGSQLFATNQAVDVLATTVNNINTGGIKYFRANSTLPDSQALGTDSVAIGPNAVANNAGDVAIGLNSVSGPTTAVAGATIGGTSYSFAGSTPAGAFSIGSAGAERQIQNVAAGRLTAASTDAVNGSQLFATNQAVNNLNTTITNIAGDTSTSYTDANGDGIRYVRTNDRTLPLADSSAQGIGSTAVGFQATAVADNSLALGRDSQANIVGGVALGSGSIVDRALAPASGQITAGPAFIEYNTTDKTLLGAVSVGTATSYRQITNVADGTQAQDAVTVRQLQGAIASVAVTPTQYFHANSAAPDSLAVGAESIAVGPTTVVNGDNGVGIGNGAIVDQVAPGGTAIGQNAHVMLADGLALGTNSTAAGIQAIAIGAGATSNHANSIALGGNSITTVGAETSYTAYALADPQTSVGEVSFGSGTTKRKLTNVAAGSAATDAVNVSQLRGVSQNVVSVIGGTMVVNPDGSITGPTYRIQGNSYTTVYDSVEALDNAITSINNGGGIKYFHANSVLADSQASGLNSVAMGPQSIASGAASLAAGLGSRAEAVNAVALGQGAQANNANSVALGSDSVTQAAVGTSGTTINGTNYSFAGTAPAGTVSVGSAGAERTITNVAAGRLTATSTDAVNGSQLYATNQAIENLETGVGNLNKNAVLYDLNPDGTKKNSVTLVGGDVNAPVVISNVGRGVADNDAVNVAQLKEVKTYTDDRVAYAIDTANNYTDTVAATTLSQANDYTDQKFNELNAALDGVQDEARQAAAIGLAASSLRYDDRPGKFSVSVGGGYWRDEGAFAFGAGYTSEGGRIRANLSGVTAGGGFGVGAGMSFTLN